MNRDCFLRSIATASILLLLANRSAGAESAGATGVDASVRKVVLDQKCDDPMELAVTGDGRVIFVERGGAVKIWKPDTKSTVLAAKLEVFRNYTGSKGVSWEDGLVGITLDPGFATNHWVYLYYSPMNVSENHVSRFVLRGDQLALETEKVILRVVTQRDICCHTGGSLAFDGEGNLFISTGDNTNPFESEGYAPIDYRPKRYPWDAGKSSGNTADLRGKILRIHPEPNPEAGLAYTIPKGNLFPPGTQKTRPEIFVMGCRNPFRISIDKQTRTLYWGEVGPDAQTANTNRGPAGFDEINRTKDAGNFGWPFVIADNKPYLAYDFETKTAGPPFDPKSPRNLSPNNTGLKDLPPAQPAWIWYPYAPSARFPVVGSGGRTACAGPVYYFDEHLKSSRKLPKEFDRTLFVYEWMRNWIRAVKLDANGNIVSIRPFAGHLSFKKPMDMELGPDGCLYMIEFGTNWERNKDSQVVRLEFEPESQAKAESQ
jgi:cytochrome c